MDAWCCVSSCGDIFAQGFILYVVLPRIRCLEGDVRASSLLFYHHHVTACVYGLLRRPCWLSPIHLILFIYWRMGSCRPDSLLGASLARCWHTLKPRKICTVSITAAQSTAVGTQHRRLLDYIRAGLTNPLPAGYMGQQHLAARVSPVAMPAPIPSALVYFSVNCTIVESVKYGRQNCCYTKRHCIFVLMETSHQDLFTCFEWTVPNVYKNVVRKDLKLVWWLPSTEASTVMVESAWTSNFLRESYTF